MRLATLIVCLLPLTTFAEPAPRITAEDFQQAFHEWNEANPGLLEAADVHRNAIDDMCRDAKLGEAYYSLDAEGKADILELGELVGFFMRADPNTTREDACTRALRHQLTNQLMGKD